MAVFKMKTIQRNYLLIQLSGVWLPRWICHAKIQARNRKWHIYNAGVLKQHLGLHQPNPGYFSGIQILHPAAVCVSPNFNNKVNNDNNKKKKSKC